jgi:molecular chaperone GrpE (heat shock protein)
MPEEDKPNGATPRYRQGYFAGSAGTVRGRTRRPGVASLVPDVGTEESDDSPPIPQPVANSSPGDEIARLKRTIDEKDQAILRSVMTLQDLQQQLEEEKEESQNLRTALTAINEDETEAPAEGSLAPGAVAVTPPPPGRAENRTRLSPEAQSELDKQRREWAKIQRALEVQNNQKKAELASVRNQWFQTQQQLETESRARRIEVAQSSATISKLNRDLSSVREVISEAARAKPGWSTSARVMTVASVCAAILFVTALTWTQVSAHTSTPAPSLPETASMGSAVQGSITTVASQTSVAAPSETAHIDVPQVSIASAGAFQGSLSRLNRSLTAHGNKPVEQILREVRNRSGDPTVCAFQWNNGQPALLYGGTGLKMNLSSALTRCALAVERSQQK